MHIDPLLLIGGGGHAKVVIDALLVGGVSPTAIRVLDQDARRVGDKLLDIDIELLELDERLGGHQYHLAIGRATDRIRLAAELDQLGAVPRTVTHHRASVALSAKIAEGSLIAAQAIVGPSAWIGSHVIINHGAIVDHDCNVGAFCHIAPNATLGGAVDIGESVLIGASATVLPGIRIGRGALIGAGAVVTRNVEDGEKLIVVPITKS